MDIYQTVTDQIIAAIEEGVQRDGKPLWSGQEGANILPHNAKSGRRYSGTNVLLLWIAAQTKGYTAPGWLTYKQAAELAGDSGGGVRKGEKATHICFFDTIERTDADTDEICTAGFLRGYSVFNLDQCDGMPASLTAERHGFQGIAAADQVMRSSGATILEGGAAACYLPVLDTIRLPDRDRFKTAAGFYSVCMHELSHWTGHPSRLFRDFSGRWGSESYGMEELTAEVSAAFLCADLGLVAETLPSHASYVESWLRALKSDKKAIFTSAAAASKAHAYLMTAASAGG